MSIWQAVPALECDGELLLHRLAVPYRRRAPRIECQPAWLKDQMLQHITLPVKPPDAVVIKFRNAIVHGPGFISLPGGVIVTESLHNWGKVEAIGHVRKVESDRYEIGDLLGSDKTINGLHVLIKQIHDENYGHWLLEGLPRVGLVQEMPCSSDARYILSGGGWPDEPALNAMLAVMRDGMAALGVGPERIMHSDWRPLRFSELLYPLPLTRHPWEKSAEVIKTLVSLEKRLPRGAYLAPQKIFVQRASRARRQVLNQDIIWSMLKEAGYARICPADYSFADQVHLFGRATHVVGIIGAECSNIVFAPSGVRFLGLGPEEMPDDFFYDIVGLKQGRYACVHGPSINRHHDSDFTVDEEIFRLALADHELAAK